MPLELIHAVVKQAVQGQDVTPVFMGSAYKNKGVQPLLDAVVRYLPSPLERKIKAKAYDDPTKQVPLAPDPDKPMVGMAFKIVDDPYGQLTFMRIYQGKLEKGEMYFNQRTGQKERFSRIVRMHADQREDIDIGRGRRHRGRHGRRRRQRRHVCPRIRNTARWKACSCPSRSSRWPSTRPSATAPTA